MRCTAWRRAYRAGLPRADAAAGPSGDIWQRPDEGIWETRGGREQFTYSKMMAWVAFDRAIIIAKKLHSKAPIEKWEKLRDTIHDEICQKAFNKEKNAFVQFYGGKHLDASLLLMPIVGFLPATDPRVRGTIEAIERNLMSTASFCATTPPTSMTACRPAKASFSPAASGW